MHKRNKRKHPLQFLCQTRERKLTPSDRQVCIHKDWWTEIIWNKDEECYYTNGLLKRLHNYDETDSEEESQGSDTAEPTVDQQIQQMPIDPTLRNSPLVSTMKLSENTMTMTTTTEQATATMAMYKTAPMQLQKITTAMQQAFQQKKKSGPPRGGSGPPRGGSGPPRGGSGPPRGGSGPPRGGSGPPGGGGVPGGGQPPAAQQPVPPTPDIKAMGSLPQIFCGD